MGTCNRSPAQLVFNYSSHRKIFVYPFSLSPFSKISTYSDGSHLGWRVGLSHLILKVGQLKILSAQVSEQKIIKVDFFVLKICIICKNRLKENFTEKSCRNVEQFIINIMHLQLKFELILT